jgi:hypothetical protein
LEFCLKVAIFARNKKTCRDEQVLRRDYDRKELKGRNFEDAGARPVGFSSAV